LTLCFRHVFNKKDLLTSLVIGSSHALSSSHVSNVARPAPRLRRQRKQWRKRQQEFYASASTPTASSQPYESPFLVALNLTVKAIAVVSGSSSTVASQIFSPGIASGTLVWSDEFSNNTGLPAQPDRAVWTYDTGNSGFGNGGVCWNRRISPYRGSTTLFGCLHLGAAENSGFIQLSIWTPGSSRPGA
jgi:hypothetical protein